MWRAINARHIKILPIPKRRRKSGPILLRGSARAPPAVV
ncbi:hypothetical protein MICA_409 [Micavibrio aeruginosavorus ARL-13]|uniref:Uncharacterized protein n=1 Tax=Micavibrio aeruginosavorus (strain ARL-13) TaxID=856793 RepID=G2KS70_MICAA|nr:hypothetical protein MICA_409 [Micavibrio aeruginosavorus ARL-13]